LIIIMADINTNKLKNMIGKEWMNNTYTYRFLELETEEGCVVLHTDKKEISFRNQAELNFFLKDCLPVHPTQPSHKPAPIIEKDVLAEVKGLLVDNIRQLKHDKEHIQQANAMAKQVNALVQLVNLEVQTRKAMNKGEI